MEENEKNRVEVKPLPKKPWHKNVGKDSFTRTKKIQALVDADLHEYSTGLSETDIAYLKNEKKVQYDLSSHFNSEVPHPFWSSSMATIKLENHSTYFYLDRPLDYIKHKVMLASKFVANSLREWEEGKYPFATHYIHDQNIEMEIKATKTQMKNEAIRKSFELSRDKKAQIILVLSGISVRNKSEDFITVQLDDLIESRTKEVLDMIVSTPEDLQSRALVLECLLVGHLTQKGHKIYYFNNVLGTTPDEVAAYLDKAANQTLKIKLMELLTK